ncbi:PepSY domain-containing protein [Brevibacillus sp. 179-C9.3 HS]|uniref:PepSY domain-containing protein n=1 Tax=unclassified Brevibacillus TaxID=2684853 RepID=UPI0039A3D859
MSVGAITLAFSLPLHAHGQVQSGHPVQQTQITEEQAKQIALLQVKGRVVHVELETENGVLVYEVIILTDQNQVFEVEVHAQTGKVLKVERENL